MPYTKSEYPTNSFSRYSLTTASFFTFLLLQIQENQQKTYCDDNSRNFF